MNRRTILFLNIALASWLLFAQCAREVTIDLPETPTKIVAICHFTHGQPFKIKVTLSQPVYDAQNPVVPDGAEVTLAKEGAFIDKLFRVNSDGQVYWQSRDSGEVQVPYSIAVRVDGLPTAQAASMIPKFFPLKPVKINQADITETLLPDGRKLLNIPLHLHLGTLPADNRYFAFFLRHDIDVMEANGTDVSFTYEGLVTNYSADGRTLSLLHDTPEPAVLINEKFWSDGRDSLLLDARIAYAPAENERPRRLYVEWRTLSADFYKYHLSLDRQGSNLPLSDPDAVYNNVSDGYGNFSGYAIGVEMIELPF